MTMKINFIIVTLMIMLFLLTGCSTEVIKESWSLKFHTASENGICYCFCDEEISTSSGMLVFQNKSNLPVHLYIYNDSKEGRLEYESDLDLGGMLSYSNICVDNNYKIGIRVFDGRGMQDVEVMVYSNFELVPYNFKEL